jgi:protein TonB
MFETSVVRARAQAARGRFSLLTVSVVAHTAIIVGVVAISIASVDFPATAPDEYARAPVFATVQIPPPLGNPNGGAPPRRPEQQQQQRPAPAQPSQTTAPPVVPENVTPVETQSNGNGDTLTSGTGTEPGPIGVPWGDPDSPGELDAPPVVAAPPRVEERVYEAHEVKRPVILTKVEPRYPQAMMKAGLPATVVVRCIIDKKGHVRDAEVIVPAMPPFNAEVLKAVGQWRFTPGMLNGQPVDTYMNLTVRFEVKR